MVKGPPIPKPSGQFFGVVQEIGLHQLWKISNLLSLSRLILIIPVCFLLVRDQDFDKYIALSLMVVAAITDYLDGYLARKLNQVTELGKILDPISDKICLLAVALCLASPSRPVRFSYSLLTVALLRDTMIVVCGYWAYRAKNVIMVSNWWGKWTSSVFAILTIIVTLEVPDQPWYLFFIDVHSLTFILFGLLIISSLSYFTTFLDVASSPSRDNDKS